MSNIYSEYGGAVADTGAQGTNFWSSYRNVVNGNASAQDINNVIQFGAAVWNAIPGEITPIDSFVKSLGIGTGSLGLLYTGGQIASDYSKYSNATSATDRAAALGSLASDGLGAISGLGALAMESGNPVLAAAGAAVAMTANIGQIVVGANQQAIGQGLDSLINQLKAMPDSVASDANAAAGWVSNELNSLTNALSNSLPENSDLTDPEGNPIPNGDGGSISVGGDDGGGGSGGGDDGGNGGDGVGGDGGAGSGTGGTGPGTGSGTGGTIGSSAGQTGLGGLGGLINRLRKSLKRRDPIVLDLTGNGINLTAENTSGTYFDFDGNGFAERTGWVGTGTAFLVSLNGATSVTSESQLISSIEDLRAFDDDGDGVISSTDSSFSSLRVWTDENRNGTTDTGELLTLSDLGIVSIDLNFESQTTDLNGNTITSIGQYMLSDGVTRAIASVTLVSNSAYTHATETPSIPDAISVLPQIMGGGQMYDLHSSMVYDAVLAEMVQEFVMNSSSYSAATATSNLESIMYEWAGVGSLSAASGGSYLFDARKLAFIEKYLGVSYDQAVVSHSVSDLQKIWSALFGQFAGRMLEQTSAGESLLPEFSYNATLNEIVPTNNIILSLIELQIRLGSLTAQNQNDWRLALDVVNAYKAQNGVDDHTLFGLLSTTSSPEIASIANALNQGLDFTFTSNGVEINGSTTEDEFFAGQGIAKLVGNGGGNFGGGTDFNDTFNYAQGDGSVEIDESDVLGGSNVHNQLIFDAGIDPSSVKDVAETGNGDITLTLSDGSQIVLDGMARSQANGVQIITFSDGTTWSRNDILKAALTSNSAALFGDSTVNTLHSTAINAYLNGGGGGDTFIVDPGAGTVEISENSGDTTPNTLRITGYTENQVIVKADTFSRFEITFSNSTDKILLDGALLTSDNGVQKIVFDDGTTWTIDDLYEHELETSAGADYLVGKQDVAELFNGLGGSDTIVGRSGEDTFVYQTGFGSLEIDSKNYSAQNSILSFGEGITMQSVTVSASAGGAGIAIKDGTAGDEIVIDGALSDPAISGIAIVQFADGTTLSAEELRGLAGAGSSGADTLYGASGGSVMNGLGGADFLIGTSGNDTFIYHSGYGALEISSENYLSQLSVLRLGSGIDRSSIHVTQSASNNDLIITDEVDGDIITINGMLLRPGIDGIQRIEFANGDTLTASELINLSTTGTSGADTLYGTANADVFDGKGGGDYLVGQGGADTFTYEAGYGALKIREVESGSPTSVLKFGEGITASSLTVGNAFDGNDLVISDGIAGDDITISEMLVNSSFVGIGKIEFSDGTSLSSDQIFAMEATGDSGSNTLYGTSRNDVFDGKGGGDYINEGGGSDTVMFSEGYGRVDVYGFAESSTVKFTEGIFYDKLSVSVSDSNLVLSDGTSGDEIILEGMLSGGSLDTSRDLTSVSFADGSSLSASQLFDLSRTVKGTTGSDKLDSGGNDLILDGLGGNDTYHSYYANDTFVFNSGYGALEINNEKYAGGDFASMLRFGPGITEDSLRVTSDGNNLVIKDGVDGDAVTVDYFFSEYGWAGINSVQLADGTSLSSAQLIQMEETGGIGADTLYGTSGADTIDGRGGNDLAIGRGGADTFIYNAGYGALEISSEENSAPTSVLRLGDGITASSITVRNSKSGTAIQITDGIDGDAVTIDNMFSNSGANGIGVVEFSDGSTLTAQQLIAMNVGRAPEATYIGTSGADSIYGSSQDDLFDGKGGGDYVKGNAGNDTFEFNQGYGALEVDESWYNGQAPVLQLGAGISASMLKVSVDDRHNGLLITAGSAGDSIDLDYMLNDGQGVASVRFADGSVLSKAQLIAMETSGTSGSDSMYGTSAADLFDGKGGVDYAKGGGGNDTFVFNQGYGQLEIDESINDGATTTLQLGAGITRDNLKASFDAGTLVLTDGISGDQIRLDSQKYSGNGINLVQFSDGSTLTDADLRTLPTTGTVGSDSITGSSDSEVIDGKGGTDYVNGNWGDDTFIYNQGYGSLEIDNSFWYGQNPVLKLGSGISESSLQVTTDANHTGLILTDGISGDQIHIDNIKSTERTGVTSVQFADGMTMSAAELIGLTTTGTAGNDTLYGSPYNDAIDGKGGVDSVTGNGGSDTYVFNAGYGSLTINNSGSGTLALGGAAEENVWFSQVGDDLQIQLMGTSDKVTVQNGFGYFSQLHEITATATPGGSVVEIDSGLSQLIQAMANFSSQNPGFDPTSAANPAITDPTVLAAAHNAWHA
ncbi:calcium-binding protein [Robbsia sp. KACC 23696]|uniref:beta strand repeat-containing protein n=1 Tax=Robbsia sp. KACC 23696 TaxID=3149231 RepID=UPI00325AEBFF